MKTMTHRLSSHRWWDFPAALLLLAAIQTAAIRLASTGWTVHLSIVQNLAFFGVILGLALGQSQFSPRIAGILAFLYGAYAIPWQLGSTLKDELIWQERLSILINRLGVILFQLKNQEVVQDSLLFLILMCILFWSLSAHAGYTLVRHGNAWLSILPGGLALYVIHSFDPLITRRAWYLAVYLFFGLVLIARMAFLHKQEQWRESRTATPPHLGLDLIRITILASLLITLIAWTVPALANAMPGAQNAWQPVQIAWKRTLDRFDNAFASLKSSIAIYREVYGSNALLGRGNPLSDAQMFSVQVPASIPPSIRFYWRARAYERYENGQWQSAKNTVNAFNPDQSNLPTPNEYGRWLGSFDFTAVVHMNTLLTPPQPLWVNRPGQVEYAENPDKTIDILTFRANPSLDPGQMYKVQSAVSYSTIAQLKISGAEYPKWINDRYLQLPDSITPRTRQLAERITAELSTPYDKVLAVTEYLRNNIVYVEVIDDEPPIDQDLVDWFLFDYKKGFCNYYSTAEVVLLRSLGIPSRWSIGYAQGDLISDPTLERENGRITYIVRQRDAHAWPEVYFPGVGWIEFEPTSAQPDIARLEYRNTEGDLDPSLGSSLDNSRRRDYEKELDMLRQQRRSAVPVEEKPNHLNVLYWIMTLAIVVSMFYLVWRFRSRWIVQSGPGLLEATFIKLGIRPPKTVVLWARQAELPPLAKAYSEINRALSRIGKPAIATDTPTERAAALGQLVPPTEKDAKKLVDEYNIGTFSDRPANLAVAIISATEIKRLTFEGFLQRSLSRLKATLHLTQRSE
jgi:transglutaminase-like putative cysteine protease